MTNAPEKGYSDYSFLTHKDSSFLFHAVKIAIFATLSLQHIYYFQ